MDAQLLHSLRLTTIFVPVTLLAGTAAYANPEGGQVVRGQATITSPDPQTLNINQSTNKAVINWNSFDIGTGETTQFFVPDRSGVTLNRVTGGDNPSELLGTLKSNGTVFIINPDGILFGPDSVIDVGGLVASTANIEDDNFMAGNYRFSEPGRGTASIVNQGTITVKDEGVAALVAPGVRNEGIITAKLGQVVLGSANVFTLDFYGDDLLKLELDDQLTDEVIDLSTGRPLEDRVSNAGTLKADGGTVALKAAAARKVVNSVINNTGVIEANSVGMKNGKIVLSAATAKTKKENAPVQKVKVSGTLNVAGTKAKETGGTIELTGERIDLVAARLIANGDAGGGTVLIGGDYKGGNATSAEASQAGVTLEAMDIPTADSVWLDENSSIEASALALGDGGKVVIWSDDTTSVKGRIEARGGATTGDGGFVETSGKRVLELGEYQPDAAAFNGASGTWLLDPVNINLSAYQSSINAALAGGTSVFLEADNRISGSGISITNTSNGVELSLLADVISLTDSSIKSTSDDFTLRLVANDMTLTNTTIINKSGYVRMGSRDPFVAGTERTLTLSGSSISGGNAIAEDEIEIGDFESVRILNSTIAYSSLQMLGYQIEISNSRIASSGPLAIGTDCADSPVLACSTSFLRVSDSQITNKRLARTQAYDPEDPNESSLIVTDFSNVSLTNTIISTTNADVYFTKKPNKFKSSTIVASNGGIYFGTTKVASPYSNGESQSQAVLNPDVVVGLNQRADDLAHNVVPPIGIFDESGISKIEWGFLSDAYLKTEDRQHLGVDIPADKGQIVRSNVTGTVVYNKCLYINCANKDNEEAAFVIIRADDGLYHVIGHVNTKALGDAGTRVIQGMTEIGTVILDHVHWGVNSRNPQVYMDEVWGWGRAPATATPSEVAAHGWIDPLSVL